MPRAKKAPAAPESPAETTTEKGPKTKAFHPLFPAVDLRSISSLWVYRVVKPRRARSFQTEMLEGPVDPGSLTSDATLRRYGPGIVRVMARRQDGGVLGEPYEMRFPDERGHVPIDPEEFDPGDEQPAAPPDPLRVELSLLKERMAEERASWRDIIAEERAQRRADVDSLVKLTERVLDAQKATAAPAPATEAPAARADGWMRQEFQRVTRELEKANKELTEHKERFFKLQAKKGDAPEEWGPERLMQVATFVREFMRDGGAGHATPPAAPPSGTPAVPEGFVNFAGEVIPGLELLDAAIKGEGGDVAKALSDDGLATFKRLHAKGMLPRSYEQRLAPVLGPLG